MIRRDDHKRDRLWVLSIQDTDLFPEEAELETELKQSNPKGQLLEFCMRLRIDPPEVEVQQQGAFHLATMTLVLDGQTLGSGPCQAAAKKTAQQLAARRLLELVQQREETEMEVIAVTEQTAAQLQSDNPKGACWNGAPGIELTSRSFSRVRLRWAIGSAATCWWTPSRRSSLRGTSRQN